MNLRGLYRRFRICGTSYSGESARWGRRWPRRCSSALPLIVFLTGCADCRFLSEKCPQPRDPQAAADTPAPDVGYRVGCPDVLELSFTDFPGWDALVAVDLDGRLPLLSPGRPHAEGRTIGEIRAELARMAGVPPEHVSVRLAAPGARGSSFTARFAAGRASSPTRDRSRSSNS